MLFILGFLIVYIVFSLVVIAGAFALYETINRW